MRAEGLGPPSRRQLLDEALRARGDPEEDIFQVREGRDIAESAALDEGIEERGAVGALEAAGKQPILATDRDDPEAPQALRREQSVPLLTRIDAERQELARTVLPKSPLGDAVRYLTNQ